MIYGVLPTVPEYFQEFINKNVDLTMEPKQCCPFHKEDTPSFSYDGRTGRWSCFGQCHAHGGVIQMHRRWFHFTSDEEAELDLLARYRVPKKTLKDKILDSKRASMVPQELIDRNVNYTTAVLNAKTPEQWIELDSIMSEFPVNEADLIKFNYRHNFISKQENTTIDDSIY